MNILIFSASYLLIVISVVGYGLLFNSSFHSDKKKINFGYAGILGLFVLIIYSYVSSFFISHSIIHNTAIITLGILFFIIKLKKNFRFNKYEYLIFFLIFLILYISALAYKTNEDFPYYHFNYTMLLTERPSLLGIGAFNHGFRTPSSLFYVNSLFYLPYVKFFSFHMAAILIMGFANFILLQKIKDFIKNNKFNFITYLSLLSFVFINIVFYRIAEHGTDRSAQILILIIIIELLLLINFFDPNQYKKKFRNILVLIGITLSLKAFYILYIVFVIYLLFFLYKKINLFKIIKENILYLFLLFFLTILVLTTNIQNSACLLYPVKFTCFSNLPWAFSEQELTLMSTHYENWAKGGAGPGFKVAMDPEIYIQNFNWVSNWVKVYFLEKGVNTVLGTLTIALVVFLTFRSQKKIFHEKRLYKFVLFLILLLFLEWFWKHPAFRYGGFCLLALLIFLPTSLVLEKFHQEKFRTKIITLIIVVVLVFLGRNLKRLSAEIKQYDYHPIEYTFYHVNENGRENFFIPNREIESLIIRFEDCNKSKGQPKEECVAINKKIGFFYGKYFFKKNK